MARDFRAKQVRTSIIIGSGSVESTKPHLGLVFYSASKASDFNGTRKTGGAAISIQSQPGQDTDKLNLTDARIGDDVWCLFDGHPQAAGAMANERTYGSTVLFLGNVAVSGSLFAERQTIEVDSTIAGNFVTPETTNHYLAGGFHGDGTYNASTTAGGAQITNKGDASFDGFVQTNIIKNHNSSNLTIDTVTNGDIIMTAAGGNIAMRDDDQAHDIFDFNVAEPAFTIYDDGDVDGNRDYFKIEVGAGGATKLYANSDAGSDNTADLTLQADGTIHIDSSAGAWSFNKGPDADGPPGSTAGVQFGYLKADTNDFEWWAYGDGSNAATATRVITLSTNGRHNANTTIPSVRIDTSKKLEFRDAGIYIHSHEADGLKMEADGHMLIGSTLVDTKTLTLGNEASTHMKLSPSDTAANEKIHIKNAAGDTEAAHTTGAIFIEAAAGGIGISAQKKIVLEADGGEVDIKDSNYTRFRFDSLNDRFFIFNKDGTQDYFTITCGTDGETTLATNHHEGSGGHQQADLKLDADGDIHFDAHDGDIAYLNAGTLQGWWEMNSVATDIAWHDADDVSLFSMANTTEGGTASSLRMSTSKKLEFHDASQYIHAPSDNNLTIKAPSALTLETDQYGAICTRPEGIHLGNQARNGVASVSGNNSKVRIFVASGSMNKASAANATDPFDQQGTGVISGISDGALVFSNRNTLASTNEQADGPEDFSTGRIVFDGQVVMGAMDVTNLTVLNTLRVQGTTTTLNTETITSTDPVIDIGGVQINPEGGGAGEEDDVYSSTVTNAEADKDRGIVMRYWTGGGSQTAFMGIDPGNPATFKYLATASESSGEWTGGLGNGQFAGITYGTSGDHIGILDSELVATLGGNAMRIKKVNADARLKIERYDSAIAADEILGDIQFGGSESSNAFKYSSGMFATATEAWDPGSNNCASKLQFYTRQTSSATTSIRMTILDTGRVGIGDVSPDAKLEIKDTGEQLRLTNNTGEYASFNVSNAGALTLATVGAGSLDSHLVLDVDGNIELNADSGIIELKDGDTLALKIDMVTTSGDAIFKDTGDAEIFRIDGDADSLLMATDKKIEFYDSSQYINAPSDATLRIAAGTNIYMVCDSLFLDSATRLNWGSGNAQLIHSNGLLASDVEFRAPKFSIDDANSYITHASSNLEIVTDGDIVLNAGGGDITLKDDSNVAFSINTTTENTGIINDQAGAEVFRITNNLVRMASGKKIEFGAAEESIHGDTNDLIISSGRHVVLNGASAQLNFNADTQKIYLDSNEIKFRDGVQTTAKSLSDLASVAPAAGVLLSATGPNRAKSLGGMVISSRDKYVNETNIFADSTPNPSDLFFYVGDDAGSRTNAAFKNSAVISGSIYMADNTISSGHALTTTRLYQNAGQTICTTVIRENGTDASDEVQEHFWLKPGGAGVGGLFLHANRKLVFSDQLSSGDEALNIQRVLHTVEGNASQKCMQHKGHIIPQADNTFNLGTADRRFANLYTGDLHLNNMGSSNDVDGTSGNWTIQEGEDSLFVINNITGKKFKMMLQPIGDGE